MADPILIHAVIIVLASICSLSTVFIVAYYLRVKCSRKKRSLGTNADIEQGNSSSTLIENSSDNLSSKSLLHVSLMPSRRFSFGRNKSTSPVAVAQPIPCKARYAEIPQVIHPLTPPRAVVLLEDIGTLLTDDVKYDVFMTKTRLAQSSYKTLDSTSLKCKMVIGVHATPDFLAGYCVNLKEDTCQIYTYDATVLPWVVENEEDEIELGAKNLLFALLLWEKDIIKAKKVRLYVGEEEILSEKSNDPLIQNCQSLLQHYKHCCKVEWINEGDMCVNNEQGSLSEDDPYYYLSNKKKLFTNFDYFAPISKPDLSELFGISEYEFQKFAQFIQPVEDLAFGRNKLAEEHLRSFFGLQSDLIFKTHCQKKFLKSEHRYWMEKTHAYDAFLEKVHLSKQKWSKPCPKCNVDYELHGLG